ncbi:hypothetical protein BRUM_1776 [Bifidobacterium ruminantium]|uniref:Uncharacterized protein n=1 Tax=Bifidobacterium ruminantium TaxID=78346 RepID=A0A087CT46_BIFRU|nr:hypothetical protein BRUM_1776 [Bifidobacterium ruminantium]
MEPPGFCISLPSFGSVCCFFLALYFLILHWCGCQAMDPI